MSHIRAIIETQKLTVPIYNTFLDELNYRMQNHFYIEDGEY